MRQSVNLSMAVYGLFLVSLPQVFGFIHFGWCPDLDVQQGFDLDKYQGQWFEQAGYNTKNMGLHFRCVYANYTVAMAQGYMIVQNSGINELTDTWEGMDGTVEPEDSSKTEGKLIVTFHFDHWLTVNGPYWVLGTDYDNVAVVYTCRNKYLFFHEYTVWLMSRERIFPSQEAEDDFYSLGNQVLNANNIDPSLLKKASQSMCHP